MPKNKSFNLELKIFFRIYDRMKERGLIMEKFDYKTTGTCAQVIHFERDCDKRIHNISFEGGCNGNLKAVSKLCEGMTAEEISAKLLGNLCRDKGTSCADQLAKAVMSVN